MASALTVPIDGSTRGLEAALRDATGQINGFGNRVSGTLRRTAGVFATAFAGTEIVGFLGDSITAAGDLEEAGSKAGAIFGESMMAGLQQFASTGAFDLGMSEQQVLDSASTFGVLGKAAGLGGEDLVGFSQELVTLAADMASFNNTSPEEAIEAIGAGLRGEAEPLRRFGVLLDDATLRSRAMEEGIWDGEGAFTAQMKSMAAAAEIMAQTTDQQGDFAKTSDGLAGQTKILQAQFANLQVEIGAKLLPIAVRLATWFNNEGLPAIQRFGSWLETNIPPILQAIGDWFERHQETIQTVMETIWSVLTRVWSEIQTHVQNVLTMIQGLWNVFAGIFNGDWSQFWNGIKQIFASLWGQMVQLLSLQWEMVKAVVAVGWEAVKAMFSTAKDALISTVSLAISTVLTFFVNLPGNIVSAIGDLSSILYNAGLAVLQGLWDGMKAKWSEVTGWLSGLGGAIVDLKGPPEADAVLLTGNGRLIMESLRKGMEFGFNADVKPYLTGITGTGIGTAVGGRGAVTGGASAPIHIQLVVSGKVLADEVITESNMRGGLPILIRAAG